MKRLLFIYDHRYPHLWQDGLYGALKLLEPTFQVERWNLSEVETWQIPTDTADVLLGWGAFGSPVDRFLSSLPNKKGLCIAGNVFPPDTRHAYDVLFHETDWYRPQVADHPNVVKAFGVNTDIYKPDENPRKLIDVLTVGAFALWKRQERLIPKKGVKVAIGEVQRGNREESMQIIEKLIDGGCAVMDMTTPLMLARFYNASRLVYIPADVYGGGERAVLEAKACGVEVDVEGDNPKLIELMMGSVPTHRDYADQLRKGLEAVL